MSNEQKYYNNYWKSGGAGGYATPNLWRWSAERKRLLIEAIEMLPESAAVLDAGCGAGEFSKLLSGKRLRVVGIDLSPVPLMNIDATCATTPLNFAAASVEGKLPFADNSFSAIWTTEVVEHLLDVPSTFADFHRVLKPQGLLVLITPYHSMVKNLILTLDNFENISILLVLIYDFIRPDHCSDARLKPVFKSYLCVELAVFGRYGCLISWLPAKFDRAFDD